MTETRIHYLDLTGARSRHERVSDFYISFMLGLLIFVFVFSGAAAYVDFTQVPGVLGFVVSCAAGMCTIGLVYAARRSGIWRHMRRVQIAPYGKSLFKTWRAVRALRSARIPLWATANLAAAVCTFLIALGISTISNAAAWIALSVTAVFILNAVRLLTSSGPIIGFAASLTRYAVAFAIVAVFPWVLMWLLGRSGEFLFSAGIVRGMDTGAKSAWGLAVVVGLLGVFGYGVYRIVKFRDAAEDRLISTTRSSAQHVQRHDRRQPIIYLRAFDDDATSYETQMQWRSSERGKTLETVIAAELRPLGPFVAIGRPGEMRPAGAARAYYTEEKWRPAIIGMIDRAQLIVAVAGGTPGLQWELSNLVFRGHLRKVAFIIPSSGQTARVAWLRHALSGTSFGALVSKADLTRARVVFLAGDDLIVACGKDQPSDYELGMIAATYAIRVMRAASATPRTIDTGLAATPPEGAAETLAAQWRGARQDNNVTCITQVAWCFEWGMEGAPKNQPEAARLYRIASDAGYPDAQFRLGEMYERGWDGKAPDQTEAARLYRLGAEHGDARAHASYGLFCEYGQGDVPLNLEEAVRHYWLGATNGDARAQAYLGVMYYSGRGIEENHIEAVRWWKLSAEQGNAHAQGNLGFMYQSGYGGLEIDLYEAERLFRLSANQGDRCGQSNLGVMYSRGSVVAKDDAEAARLYRLAANQGYATAQANLAELYEKGEGVAGDDAEALRLYKLAAQQGDSVAQKRLIELGEAF